MMKNKVSYLTVCAVIIALIVLAVIIAVSNGGKNETGEESQTETSFYIDATMPTYEKNEDGTLPSDAEPVDVSYELCSISDALDKDDVLLVSRDFSYPVFSGFEHSDEINATVKKLADRLTLITETEKAEAEDDYLYFNFSEFEFMPSVRVGSSSVYVIGNAISIVITVTESGNGANSDVTLYALNFNIQTGKSMALTSFLNKSSEYLTEYVYDVFAATAAENPSNYYQTVLDDLKIAVSLNNYYLSEQGVTLFCRSGEIAPIAFGDISVTIPYETFK